MNVSFAGTLVPGMCAAEAHLTYASFRRAVGSVDLSRADLTGTDLEFARLGRSDFRGSRLTGAHLYGTELTLSHLEGVDLSQTRGLADRDVTGKTDAATILPGKHWQQALGERTGRGPWE